jgi:hypothetical protein
VVRGIALTRGFPRRQLLEHHLVNAELQEMWTDLCTLNALAVLPSHRGGVYEAVGLGWRGSVGKLLMLSAIRQMELRGLRAALATAGGIVSTRLLPPPGLPADDPPTRRPDIHPELVMTNVGLVFGSPGHLRAQQDCAMALEAGRPLGTDAVRLLRYFEARQSGVLGARTIADLIREEGARVAAEVLPDRVPTRMELGRRLGPGDVPGLPTRKTGPCST